MLSALSLFCGALATEIEQADEEAFLLTLQSQSNAQQPG